MQKTASQAIAGQHQGKKSVFDYSGLDCCSECYFTAFYADCQHEVEKVTNLSIMSTTKALMRGQLQPIIIKE